MVTMTAPLLSPAGAADAPAASTPGGAPVSYAELTDRSRALAHRLAGAGLRPGDRVATLSANSVEQVVLFYACALGGFVLVPLSWRAAPAELAGMLADADPVLLAHDAAHAALAGRANAGRRTPLVELAGLEHEPPQVGPAAPLDGGSPDDPVLLLFTSGSSGRPKGVPLSQANCRATNEALAGRFPMAADDVVLQVLPQFHVAGWNVQPLLAWSRGARVVVVPDFDAGLALDTIERERVTTMMGVPTVYEMLAAEPDFPRRDLTSLRTVVVGGAPVGESLGRAWAAHGVRIWAGYGLTEAGPNVLCEPPEALAGSTGWMAPYDGVDVRLDADGQLLVRGPGVFAGYWADEAATREVLHDGWLATGDLAERSPAGLFRIRGRSSEKYISGGENVHPAEVEIALRRLPGVAEAAVVAVPDERWGEAGVAFVVPCPGTRPTSAELRERVREHLAGFKVPREVVVVDALPLTGSGKVDKRDLRARLGGGR